MRILESEDEVEFLFSDILLPNGMNGIELVREAQRRNREIRVLLASGYAADVSIRHEAAHEFHIIQKPFRFADLAKHLRAASS
jgi:DNA-binding NtrC family response regulator